MPKSTFRTTLVQPRVEFAKLGTSYFAMRAKRRLSYSPKNANKRYRKAPRRVRRARSRVTLRATRSSQGPVAARLITKVKYVETVALSCSLTATSYEFRLNSIFDPNYTGGGHQPLGHDQLATLYNRYRVFKCAWRIKAQSTGSNAPRIVVVPYGNSLTTLTFDRVAELPRAITRTLGINGASNGVQIAGHISLPNLSGETSTEFKGNSNNEALFGADPGEAMRLMILMDSPTGSSATAQVSVQLIYYVECFDPLNLAQS